MTTTEKRKYLYRKPDPKTGRPWVYFRYADGTLETLPRDETAAEFARHYDRCLAMRNGLPIVVRPKPREELPTNVKFGPATIGRFIELYLASDLFTKPRGLGGLADGTKAHYRRALEITRKRLGSAFLHDLDEEGVEVYMAEIKRDHSASVADVQRSLLSSLWVFAKGFREFKRNGKSDPTRGVKKLYRVARHTKAWPEHVQTAFFTTARSTLVDAYMLLRYTAQRGGDATKLKWSDLDETREHLMLVQEKTGTVVWHKLPDPLVKWLRAMERKSDYVLLNARGRPWANSSSLGHAIQRHLEKLNIPGSLDRANRVTMHGLRATVAAEIGSLGAGTEGIKAVTGHKDDRLARQYAAEQDQRRINAEVVKRWNEELALKAAARAEARTARHSQPKLRVVVDEAPKRGARSVPKPKLGSANR